MKHGFAPRYEKRERLYNIWHRMKQRCSDAGCSDYKYYGSKGVQVCLEWSTSYLSFRCWALESGYAENLTIERRDTSGNYCPENCTWASRRDQMRNYSRNHRVEFNGQLKTLAEWSEKTGVESSLIRYRLKAGWSIKDALTLMPSNTHKGGIHKKEGVNENHRRSC